MYISIEPFETLEQGQVQVCKMMNDTGASAEVLSYGGIIRCLRVPDKNGKIRDVVLGHDTVRKGYQCGYPFAAMLIGRYANRIKGGCFVTKDGVWHTEKNEGNNTLHGASGGYHTRLFAMTAQQSDDGVSVTLKYTDHGEAGFPGEAAVEVTYTLRNGNAFEIVYRAIPTMDTVISLTNHIYFNLAGHDSGATDKQRLRIACDFYTPNGEDCVPTGEVLRVDGTAFDYRTFRALGTGYHSGDPQIEMFRGYDHNLCLRGRGMRGVMDAYDPDGGISLSVMTDMPGAQLYTTDHDTPESIRCKDGAHYLLHQGFCFETQQFPNSPVFSHFPSPYAKAGELWESHTCFQFAVHTGEGDDN